MVVRFDLDELEFDMHIRAGLEYGKEQTCGTKNDFKSEQTAAKLAPWLSTKYNHVMEAYPCGFCNGWHIGRKMTAEEREKFSKKDT